MEIWGERRDLLALVARMGSPHGTDLAGWPFRFGRFSPRFQLSKLQMLDLKNWLLLFTRWKFPAPSLQLSTHSGHIVKLSVLSHL